MRRTAVEALVLVLLLGGAGLGRAQQARPPRVEEEDSSAPTRKAAPAKSKLEDMLAEALKNNPDVRVAAARVAKADAELNRTRFQVAEKVLTLYHAIEAQKAVVAVQEQDWKRMQGLQASNLASKEEGTKAQLQLTLAKAKLAELEAQLPGLLGKSASGPAARLGGRSSPYAAVDFFDYDRDGRLDLGYYPPARALVVRASPAPDGPLADRIRKALEKPVLADYKETPFPEVLADLEKKAPGLSFRDMTGYTTNVNLRFKEALPVAAILQALADGIDPKMGPRFVVRDYGILVTQARYLPPGAVAVEDFLRTPPGEANKYDARPAAAKNPPAENVEGMVKKVDPSGLMTITIGSDAGLSKGHTLEIYRLDPMPSKSKYLGTVRVLEATATQAVCQPVGRMTTTPAAGDRVASRILGQ